MLAHERCGCSDYITLTAPKTPQWESPPSTSWVVGPPALHPHGHPLWVLSASPSLVPRESAWEGAVEPRGHTGALFPLHAFSPNIQILYTSFFLIFKQISKVSVQLPAVIVSNSHFPLQHYCLCTLRMLDPYTACTHASFTIPFLSYLLMLSRPFHMGNRTHVSRIMPDGITYLFLLNNTNV